MRAFLAIPVLPPALQMFLTLREQLVSDVPGVRWAPADSAHITLHFFASITAAETERALAAVRPIISTQPAMVLRLRGLGSFPPAADPRVLWVGVDGEVRELASCAMTCRGMLMAAGFPVEERHYRAHCTLGRPLRPWPHHARESWHRHAQEEPSTPTFVADRVCLYESVAGAAGVRHVVRDVVPLDVADPPAGGSRPARSAPTG